MLGGNFNSVGGTERVGSLLANGLSQAGHTVFLASLVNGKQPSFPIDSSIKQVSLSQPTGRVLYSMPIIVYRLRKLLKKEGIDVLIVIESIAVLFSLPATLGLPVRHICWEHLNFNNDLGIKSRRLARQLAARYCDLVVTLTERDRSFWLAHTKHHHQIVAIANPSSFTVQQHHRPANTKQVVAVGHLIPIKGFDLLLQAWLIVSKAMPEWQLTIVGEGEERNRLTAFINHHHLHASVSLVGSTPHIEQYYQQSDILCLSSRFEGFPMVLLEALSFGLPVVSFDCDTGPAEILANTGSLLVPKLDVERLAQALITLMQDEAARAEISINSKLKAKHYQAEQIIKQWQQQLNSLH